MRTRTAVKTSAAAMSLVAALATASAAGAHRSPCHTQHVCPSDHHTYRWGAKKLYCTSYKAERRKRDTIVVTHGGRKYWCGR